MYQTAINGNPINYLVINLTDEDLSITMLNTLLATVRK